MAGNLLFLAGRRALAVIREKGLSPEMVTVMAGAAGGPKWIVLHGLDRAIFFSWMKKRKNPLFLLGSSIGAWRFSALAQPDPQRAYERFRYAYFDQRYTKKPTPEEVSIECRRILDYYLDDGSAEGIFKHRYMRLSMMAVRCRGPLVSESKPVLSAGLLSTALANTASRGGLKFFLERTLLYDHRDTPPFFGMDGFPIHRVPLNAANIKPALLASGAVPLVMTGVEDIPGAPRGMYRDGGLVDYHLDIPFSSGKDGIVLYPHYAGRIIPGWFDKGLSWRKPSAANMENVLMVCPSPDFLGRLPLGKIPDREDFKRFFGRDDDRIAYWNRVIKESDMLGEEFLEAVSTGKIRERVQALA